MDEVEDFSDDRQKQWCVHCGAGLAGSEVNWDHVPSRCLLNKPLPPHVPKVPVCTSCNSGFSLDEQYVAVLLSCVLAGSTDPGAQTIESAAGALQRSAKLRSRLERAATVDANGAINWIPEFDRVARIVVKNSRGHAAFEIGEPMLDEPTEIILMPLQTLTAERLAAFEEIDWSVWPEVGSRMMTRLVSGQDLRDGWVVVQEGVYR